MLKYNEFYKHKILLIIKIFILKMVQKNKIDSNNIDKKF